MMQPGFIMQQEPMENDILGMINKLEKTNAELREKAQSQRELIQSLEQQVFIFYEKLIKLENSGS